KSTLAKELHKITGLPLIHLDKEFWNTGWVKTPREEWIKKQEAFVSAPEWILDGNYLNTLYVRLKQADTVIYLDFNRFVSTYRIILRRIKYRNKTRPDLPEDCPEKIDYPFLKWVWTFNRKVRPRMLQILSEFPTPTQIILKSPREARAFINKIKK
ncbi:MAG: AAA family ATPase, partial [Clostridia bacterium]